MSKKPRVNPIIGVYEVEDKVPSLFRTGQIEDTRWASMRILPRREEGAVDSVSTNIGKETRAVQCATLSTAFSTTQTSTSCMSTNSDLQKRATEIEQIVDDIMTVVRALKKNTLQRVEDFCQPLPVDDQRARDSDQSRQPDLP